MNFKFFLWLEENQNIELWLDDERDPNLPQYQQSKFGAHPGMVWVKTVPEAKKLISTHKVSYISFDNDLGQPEEGYHLARWIEEEAYFGRLPRMSWAIHSQNSEAAKEILMAMNNADRFWSRHEEAQ